MQLGKGPKMSVETAIEVGIEQGTQRALEGLYGVGGTIAVFQAYKANPLMVTEANEKPLPPPTSSCRYFAYGVAIDKIPAATSTYKQYKNQYKQKKYTHTNKKHTVRFIP